MNILSFPSPLAPRSARPFWMPRQTTANSVACPAEATANPFAALAGLRILLLVDDDNIRISAQQLRRSFSYRTLAKQLRGSTLSCRAYAFFSTVAADDARRQYFHRRRYHSLVLKRGKELTPAGPVTNNSNADFDLVFHAGFLLALCRYDALLVASGDGDLVLALARGVDHLLPGIGIYTLSIAGATSQRILAPHAPLIAGNFFASESLLRPLVGRRAQLLSSGGRHGA